ncbi:ribonuclease HII [candidate division KSB1 bacterium]
MDQFEKDLWNRNILRIAGIDEAGRGPLAGPVVAAAVVFDHVKDIPEGIDDSKKLTPKKRAELFKKIRSTAVDIGVGIIGHTEIDKINILNATMKAMKMAVENLTVVPEYVLIDGNRAPKLKAPSETIVKGDSKSFSIAAASIIAKETRDKIMINLHERFPMYDFKNNKGYASKTHIKAIKKYGITEFHRRTFCGNFLTQQTEIPF